VTRFLLFAVVFAAGLPVLAEENGEELLSIMRQDKGRAVAEPYVTSVLERWDGTLFCVAQRGDAGALAYDAVREYLEHHPGELVRERRYLIIQALRTAYPCPTR
jgi:hypothetical protein